MSTLSVYHESNPEEPLESTGDPESIRSLLAGTGVRFERWPTRAEVRPGADPDDVLRAYADDVARLMREDGYRSADVVSVSPDTPGTQKMRATFLREHTHAEDEVRFFAAGSGLFTLHVGDRVYEVLCEEGDFIRVPAKTRHWFDMGPEPSFVAIRIFDSPDGWAAEYTGSDIAERYSRLGA